MEFVLSATNVDELPESKAEIALVGRSNVGKSALLNAVCNRKSLARVSNTPGRTQLINLFQTPTGGTVVDLPGYGYAAVSGKLKRGWEKMIVGYLNEREELDLILVLVDGVIGPTDLDLMMLEQLRASEVDFQIIATKQDKVKPSQRETRKRDLAKNCEVDPSEVVWTSTSTNEGIEKVRSIVNRVLK
jgi:GTP-binding protein